MVLAIRETVFSHDLTKLMTSDNVSLGSINNNIEALYQEKVAGPPVHDPIPYITKCIATLACVQATLSFESDNAQRPVLEPASMFTFINGASTEKPSIHYWNLMWRYCQEALGRGEEHCGEHAAKCLKMDLLKQSPSSSIVVPRY